MKLYQLYLVYEINTLEQMTTKFVKEEGIEEVVIGNVVIMLLLYADVVVHCSLLEPCAISSVSNCMISQPPLVQLANDPEYKVAVMLTMMTTMTHRFRRRIV
mgnify:CR=1 FL=1